MSKHFTHKHSNMYFTFVQIDVMILLSIEPLSKLLLFFGSRVQITFACVCQSHRLWRKQEAIFQSKKVGSKKKSGYVELAAERAADNPRTQMPNEELSTTRRRPSVPPLQLTTCVCASVCVCVCLSVEEGVEISTTGTHLRVVLRSRKRRLYTLKKLKTTPKKVYVVSLEDATK